jgi:hypothetical protein
VCIATLQASSSLAKQSISIISENDLFFGGTDGHYTSGHGIQYSDASPTPEWTRFYLDEGTRRYFNLAHTLYTPRVIGSEKKYPKDRPWAGHVYGGIGSIIHTEDITVSKELTAGIIGPIAQGEDLQVYFHEITGTLLPEGWKHQLTNEPTVSLFWQKERHFMLTPNLYAHHRHSWSIGTPFTYIGTGITIEIRSSQALKQQGALRIHTARHGQTHYTVPRHKFFWVTFVSLDGRLMGVNTFLDGNTFQDSPSVQKQNLVADLGYGFSVGQNDIRFTWEIVHRTKEFTTQKSANTFSSLSADILF